MYSCFIHFIAVLKQLEAPGIPQMYNCYWEPILKLSCFIVTESLLLVSLSGHLLNLDQ